MEQLPQNWERPVTEEGQPECVSPEIIKRLQSLLRELYKQRPVWKKYMPPLRPPTHKEVCGKLGELKGVEPLHGAKVLYLDDASQCYLPFVTNMILATQRRVERIFYHGETTEEIVTKIRQRLRLCPQPHLLLVDENLEMLPSFECAGHTEYGHNVVHQLHFDLRKAGVPAIGFSSDSSLTRTFMAAGAEGFVRKNIPAESAVEQIASIYRSFLEKIRLQKEEEERFIITD